MQARLLTADLHGAMIAGKHFHSSLLQLEMLPNGLVVYFFIPGIMVCPSFWEDYYMLIYTHCWELMNQWVVMAAHHCRS